MYVCMYGRDLTSEREQAARRLTTEFLTKRKERDEKPRMLKGSRSCHRYSSQCNSD